MTQSRYLICTLFTVLASLAATHTWAADTTAPAAADPAMYALGVLLSHNVDPFDLTEKEFSAVMAGFADGFHRREGTQNARDFGLQLQALQRARIAASAQRARQDGKAYLDSAAALPGAKKTASGLVYLSETDGTGVGPSSADQVRVRYSGKLISGAVFDSTAPDGPGATFPLSGVIPCWSEALQQMRAGGKARLVCPPELAYGDRGSPPLIRPASTVDFQIELLEVIPAAR